MGGGVLSNGCVQEEIRFAICPELIVSILFCESLIDNEAILIKGFERFSSYDGYSDSFKWLANYQDKVKSNLIVIDALPFQYPSDQYEENKINRELIKCFAGFSSTISEEDISGLCIATGHWGCGAFKGDKQVKCINFLFWNFKIFKLYSLFLVIIQLIVSSQLEKGLVYFNNKEFESADAFEKIISSIEINKLTLKDVYNHLIDYGRRIVETREMISFSDYLIEVP